MLLVLVFIALASSLNAASWGHRENSILGVGSIESMPSLLSRPISSAPGIIDVLDPLRDDGDLFELVKLAVAMNEQADQHFDAMTATFLGRPPFLPSETRAYAPRSAGLSGLSQCERMWSALLEF